MKWKNAFSDGLPSDKQEVLISVSGSNFIAVYNHIQNEFQIKNTKKFIRISPSNSTVFWAEILDPGN